MSEGRRSNRVLPNSLNAQLMVTVRIKPFLRDTTGGEIITVVEGGVEPALWSYKEGDRLDSNPQWADIMDAANYETSAEGATIQPPLMLVGYVPRTGTFIVSEGEYVHLDVQDTIADNREWVIDEVVSPPVITPPTIEGVPTVAGIIRVGETATASPAPVSGDEPITTTLEWIDDGDAVVGTGPTYTFAPADLGKTFTVRQTSVNGVPPDAVATSLPTTEVVPALEPPVISGVPTISGTPMDGETATATLAPVTGDAPITSTVEWIDSDQVVQGTDLTYTFTPADVGKTFTVKQTSTNGVPPDATATSLATAVIEPIPVAPIIDGQPTISGVAMVGEVLTATPASVSGDQPITNTFIWYDSDTTERGTGTTITLVEGDVGLSFTVEQKAANGVPPDAFSTSAPSDTVVPIPIPPTIEGVPTISGDEIMVGETVTATPAPSSGDAPITDTIEWVDSTDAVRGTGLTYTFVPGDVGKTFTAKQTSSNGVPPDATAVSAPTDVVDPIPVPPTISGVPTISGTIMVGETATATPAPVTGDAPITSSFEWIDSDTTVRGTGTTYIFVEGDLGKTFTVKQTASNGVPPDDTATSAPTSAVIPIPVPPTINGVPTIAGLAKVGETLTATAAPVTGDAPLSSTLTWYNDAQQVRGVGTTITLTEADLGRSFTVTQEATNGVPPNAFATSDPTDDVLPIEVPPSIEGVPTISGDIKVGATATVTVAPSSGDEPLVDTVEWIDSDQTVRGTALTYTFVAADAGKTFTVKQTSSNGIPPDATATSAATVPVAVAPTITGVPTISGLIAVGETATAAVAPSSGDQPITDTLEWLDSDQTVRGTGVTYTFTGADEGKTFTVRQTSSNGVPPDATATSVPTSTVLPVLVPLMFSAQTTGTNETFGINLRGTVDVYINWGDGSPFERVTTEGNALHVYASPGTHDISVGGTAIWGFDFPAPYNTKVLSCTQLGDLDYKQLWWAFRNCSNMTSFVGGTTDTSAVTTMTQFFSGCTSLATADVTGFNTSACENMGNLFGQCEVLAAPDITGWDTSKVQTMTYMFGSCKAMTTINLSNFSTASATTLGYLFWGCTGLTSLDVSGFNTSVCANMEYMFTNNAALVGLDLTGWDFSQVTVATNFLQNTNPDTILAAGGYDALLPIIDAQVVQPSVSIGFGQLKYTPAPDPAGVARQSLVDNDGWVIVDGGPNAIAPSISGVPTITGTTKEGETLTVTPASTTGTAPITNTYAWRRSPLNTVRGTGTTYLLTSSDVSRTITVEQTATNSAGADSATSAPTDTIRQSFPVTFITGEPQGGGTFGYYLPGGYLEGITGNSGGELFSEPYPGLELDALATYGSDDLTQAYWTGSQISALSVITGISIGGLISPTSKSPLVEGPTTYMEFEGPGGLWEEDEYDLQLLDGPITYDDLLINWASHNVQSNYVANMGDQTYTAESAAARQSLIDDHGWIIIDGGQA